MLKRLQLYASARPISYIKYLHDCGYLNMDPPYQRGVVWDETKQVNLIRSLLSGIPIPSIVLSDDQRCEPGSVVVIDGKQRCTAFLKFLQGKISIPSEWVMHECEAIFPRVTFLELSIVARRRINQGSIPFVEGNLTEEQQLEAFQLINMHG